MTRSDLHPLADPPSARTIRAEHAPAALAIVSFALHAACGARYGMFRDELYFLVCGERLAWGYVDQPPGIAIVARAVHAIFGSFVPGLRLLPWLAAAATVYLTGRLAARLGAGPAGAALASAAALAAPFLLALGHYLTMNAFEPLLAVALASVLAALASGADRRLWLVAGGLAAAGVLMKYTFALLALALVAGLLLSRGRRALASAPAAVGAALALALVVPNFVWQAQHGYPFLELVRNGVLHKNAPTSPSGFLLGLGRDANPLTAPLWLAGLAGPLLLRRLREARFVSIGAGVYVAALLAAGGKAYYATPALPLLLAAGAASLTPLLVRRAVAIGAPALLGASAAVIAPLALPLLPEPAFVRYQAALGVAPERLERTAPGILPQVFSDQHGWPRLAQAVAEVYRSLPAAERASAVVLAQNYGEAAALDVYGRALGLPPAASGHNTYFLWGPPPGRGDPVIVISDEHEDCGGAFRERGRAAQLPSDPWVMPYEDRREIWVCRGALRPLRELWPALRLYI